jgi:hypothetical protein
VRAGAPAYWHSMLGVLCYVESGRCLAATPPCNGPMTRLCGNHNRKLPAPPPQQSTMGGKVLSEGNPAPNTHLACQA